MSTGPRTTRRDLLVRSGRVGGALVAGGALASGLARAAAAEPDAKDALTVATFQTADSLDPGQTGLLVTYQVALAVCDPLIWHLPGYGAKERYPGLAESYAISNGGTVYTFKLRRGITFHDGTPFDAQAVKATFDHIVDPKTRSRAALGSLGPYKETRVVDRYTAQIVFKTPNAAFENEMSQADLGISSPTALKKYGAGYSRHPVGTGPFVFKSTSAGNAVIVVERNPGYRWGPAPIHKGPAPLREITFRALADPSAQANALQTGEIDIAPSLHAQDVARIVAGGRFKKHPATATGMPYGLMINVTRPPTDDVRVRRAIQYATDQDAIVKTLFYGLYEPATSLFTKTTPGYSKAQDMYPYDPKKAEQLLDQAGWTKSGSGRSKGGKPLTVDLINISGFGFDEMSLLLQAQWKKVGIQTNVSDQSFPAVGNTYNKGSHNFADFFYFDVDPFFTSALFGCANVKSGFNWMHYCNAGIDSQIAKANATPNERRRVADYQRIGTTLMRDAAFLPLYDLRTVYVAPSSLKGIAFTINAQPMFHGVTL